MKCFSGHRVFSAVSIVCVVGGFLQMVGHFEDFVGHLTIFVGHSPCLLDTPRTSSDTYRSTFQAIGEIHLSFVRLGDDG